MLQLLLLSLIILAWGVAPEIRQLNELSRDSNCSEMYSMASIFGG